MNATETSRNSLAKTLAGAAHDALVAVEQLTTKHVRGRLLLATVVVEPGADLVVRHRADVFDVRACCLDIEPLTADTKDREVFVEDKFAESPPWNRADEPQLYTSKLAVEFALPDSGDAALDVLRVANLDEAETNGLDKVNSGCALTVSGRTGHVGICGIALRTALQHFAAVTHETPRFKAGGLVQNLDSETPHASAIDESLSYVGAALPDSHFQTALRERERRDARTAREIPLLIRHLRMRSPMFTIPAYHE